MKKKKEYEFYKIDPILNHGAQYNLIIGERSNGKTYAAQSRCVRDYIQYGHQLAIVRRWEDDFKGRRGQQMFAALCGRGGEIDKMSGGQFNTIKYYSGKWYLGHTDGETAEFSPDPFAFGFALTTMEHDKSTSYPGVKNIVFDEFVSRSYLPDEFVLFMNTISTIVRQRNDVRIFMLGNTVSKSCPYFSEMGLKHMNKMEPGSIDVYKYPNGLRVAVEFTNTAARNSGKKSDVYFGFDNPKLQMITGKGGIWELEIYPHAPEKIKPKFKKYTFFIVWDGMNFSCDVCQHDNVYYLFIHEKTTELKKLNNDLIYTVDYNPAPNYRRNLLRPVDNIDKKIKEFFDKDRVYYQSNEVGDYIAAYLQWCQQN